ncbi:MAG TPA: SDR family NAD(P)-dependent oxidoreductase [Marmoricola sp.]|nr:SDR family NAD(P)-dependent oxidoreductase [Marmoricola sp.]
MSEKQYVVISGGARGLGAALAKLHRDRGDEVCIADLRPTDDSQLPLDVSSAADWDRVAAWTRDNWPRVDRLYNCAGIAGGGRIDVSGFDEFERTIDINLLGTVRGIRAFVGALKAQGSGHIINIASLAGLVHPAGMSAYSASKAGVVAISESLNFELKGYGITVSVVCPSFFQSDLSESLSGQDAAAQAIARRLIDKAPQTAADVAAEVLAQADAGETLILPDQTSRDTFAFKRDDRAGYEALMGADGAGLLTRQS